MAPEREKNWTINEAPHTVEPKKAASVPIPMNQDKHLTPWEQILQKKKREIEKRRNSK